MSPYDPQTEDRHLPRRLVTSTDGVRLPLYDLSEGGERRLLIAHATGFNARTYLPMTDRLIGFHCFGADLRGHGDANSPESDYSWPGFGEDILNVVDALPDNAPPKLYGFGHSKGGASLLMAEIERPGTFEALFLFEPIVAPTEVRESSRKIDGESPLAASARRRRSHFASRSEAYENFRSKKPMSDFHPEALDAYVRYAFREVPGRGIELKLPGPEEAEVYNLSIGHETFERLDAVRCPVRVAFGAEERPGGPASWSPAIAHRLPQGSALEMTTVGHLGPFEDPELFARTISEFFDSLT